MVGNVSRANDGQGRKTDNQRAWLIARNILALINTGIYVRYAAGQIVIFNLLFYYFLSFFWKKRFPA